MSTTAAVVLTPIVIYIISSALFPYARCRSCRGRQTSMGSNRKRWNICRSCGGSGERIRFGARLLGRRD